MILRVKKQSNIFINVKIKNILFIGLKKNITFVLFHGCLEEMYVKEFVGDGVDLLYVSSSVKNLRVLKMDKCLHKF